jgi:hypothetical protein
MTIGSRRRLCRGLGMLMGQVALAGFPDFSCVSAAARSAVSNTDGLTLA